MVHGPVEHGRGKDRVGEHLAPQLEEPVAGRFSAGRKLGLTREATPVRPLASHSGSNDGQQLLNGSTKRPPRRLSIPARSNDNQSFRYYEESPITQGFPPFQTPALCAARRPR